MKAEIMAVGTELLLGDILNTNAQFLSKELAALGIDVYYQTVVGDNPGRLMNALELAFSRADLVITTGGLGPTKDDLTKETGGRYFNRPMILDQQSLDLIQSFFQRTGRKMTENNRKQAYMPQGSVIIPNKNGTAPGCIIEGEGKMLIMLPGPPFEAEPMFRDFVSAFLSAKSDHKYISKCIRIIGVGESAAEERIADLIENQSNPTIAPYAKMSEMMFRVTASAHDEKEAERIMEPVITELYKRFGDNIYGEGRDITLEEVVVKILKDKRLTIALAESCTGGMLASKIVDCPGASDVLAEGVVTYSNKSKMNRLGVREKTLSRFGAVSVETAEEMAKGAAQTSGADIGLSITGIAGPGGGTEEKPVGTVCIGLYVKGKIKSRKYLFTGDRTKIRYRAVLNALDFLRREILNG